VLGPFDDLPRQAFGFFEQLAGGMLNLSLPLAAYTRPRRR